MTVPNLLQRAFPHTWKRAAGGVALGSTNDTIPTVGIPAHHTWRSAAADTEKRDQDQQTPVHYGEDVGLIPLCFKNGFEAIPPMPQHPCTPHPNPRPHQGTPPQKESTPTPPPPCHPFAVLGTKLQMLIASGCAATSREKPASQLLLREDMFCSQAHSLHRGPQGSQGSPRCP